jgi:hypothetical protein
VTRRKPTRERYAEDIEDLQRKGEWFRKSRTTGIDIDLGQLREAALAQAARLGTRDIEALIGPPDRVLKTGFDLVGPEKRVRVKAQVVDNPAPDGSFGFAGDVIEVAGTDSESVGLRLRIVLDRKASERVLMESVRICRYEPTTRRWVLILRSGVFVEERFAWAILHRSGTYTAVGLPRDPDRLRFVLLLSTLRPLLNQIRSADDAEALRASLFGAGGLLDTMDRFGSELALLEGIQPRPRELQTRDLPGMPKDIGGLPEFDILDDTCGPWRGKQINAAPLTGLQLASPIMSIVPPRDWISVGPDNFSGRIKSLAIDPTNRNVLYAGAADGGVWKSTNAGWTWTALMFTESAMAIGAIAVAPSNSNVIYAATGEDTGIWNPSYPGNGVYRSVDAGSNWTLLGSVKIGSGLVKKYTRCTKVLVHPGSPNHVFVASATGLWRSTNAMSGDDWSLVLPGHMCDALWDPVQTNRVWAAIWNDGVWQSNDGGDNWNRCGQGTPVTKDGQTFLVGALPSGADAGWIKLAQGRDGAGGTDFLAAKLGKNSGDVYRCRDAGVTWDLVAQELDDTDYNEWTTIIAIHPKNHDIMFAGGAKLLRTTDGKTFKLTRRTHDDHHQLVFDPLDPNICYVATDGGVFRSTDAGATWIERSSRLVATQFYSVGIGQQAFLLGGATQDQGILAYDYGTTWRDTLAGNEGGFFVVDPNNSANVYACPWDHGLRRSRDGGFTWKNIGTGLFNAVFQGHGPTKDKAFAGSDIPHLAVQPGDSNHLIVIIFFKLRGSFVCSSTDQGTSWNITLDLPAGGTRVAFAPSDGNRVYVATDDGRVFRGQGRGFRRQWSWSEPNTNKPTSQRITALAVDWNNPDIVWIGCGGLDGPRVMRSADGGTTWATATGSNWHWLPPRVPANALVIDQHNPDRVYVACDVGVYRTSDRGQSWEKFNDGYLGYDVPQVIVTDLALRLLTNTLYASTMGRGVYKRVL